MNLRCASIGVSVILASLLFGTLSPGCATTEDKRQEARAAASSFRQELATLPKQIDTTMNSLYEVTSGANTNRSESLQKFGNEIDALSKDARRVSEEAQHARAHADEYFRQWARDSVQASPSKRADMDAAISGRVTNYNNALAYLDNARDRYVALMENLTDIKRNLDANLSSYSSNEMRNMVGAAQLKSVELKNYIARLTEQIDSTLAKK